MWGKLRRWAEGLKNEGLKLVPDPVLTECRAQAAAWIAGHHATPKSIAAAVVIMLLWILFFAALWQYFGAGLMKRFGAAESL